MRWCWLIVGWLLWVQLARAEPTAERAAEPHVVEVTAAGELAPVAAIEQRTRALLVEFPVVVAWSVTASFRPRDVFGSGQRPALARIWLDARAPDRAVLYLADDAHQRFLVRVVPLDAGYDEIACESIGTIVQSSIEALLAGATVGVTRETAEAQVAAIEPEPAPAPSQPAPPPSPPAAVTPQLTVSPAEPAVEPHALGIDVGYRAALLHDAPVVRHGLELGVSLARRSRGASLAGHLQVGYRWPSRWEVGGVGADFHGAGARLAVGLRTGLTSAFGIAVLGAVGAELLHVSPHVSGSSERPRDAFTVVQPMVGLVLESELRLNEHAAGLLTVGAESDLRQHRFDVMRAGVAEPLLEAWPVQAVVRLGARWLP